MAHSQVSISLKDARPVFKEYVGKNRNLKAMKKVLIRVWDACETSIVKAALLLGKKAATYAQAASGFKPQVPMSDEQVGLISAACRFSVVFEASKARRTGFNF